MGWERGQLKMICESYSPRRCPFLLPPHICNSSTVYLYIYIRSSRSCFIYMHICLFKKNLVFASKTFVIQIITHSAATQLRRIAHIKFIVVIDCVCVCGTSDDDDDDDVCLQHPGKFIKEHNKYCMYVVFAYVYVCVCV